MTDAHEVDFPPWLKPLAKKVGASKWMRSKSRFDRKFYFESLDAFRAKWIADRGEEPGDAALAGLVALISEQIGDLRAHARKEDVNPDGEKEWADMTQAAGWTVVERYHKDIAKGKWA